MDGASQSIQENQLSKSELPFQFHSIPKKILQTNNNLGEASFCLDIHFQQSEGLQDNNMMNVSLEELLQVITTRKLSNCYKCVYFRNDEDYKADSNPQTSFQSDLDALLILLYFLPMDNQLCLLNIIWKQPISFKDFNEVMNLIPSFQSLQSLVLNMTCNQINNPDDHAVLRSFSSRIFSLHNLTCLKLTLNIEEYKIDSLEFNEFLTDLSNLRILQTIGLSIESRVYSDFAIDSLIVLSLHPSLKSIFIQSNNLNEEDNNDSFQNKNISETYLNQLNSSQLESVHLNQLNTYDFNILFAILTRLQFLKDFTISSNFNTSINKLRLPIIPYKRNSTFPVLESIEICFYSTVHMKIAQEFINGLSQFKTYKVACYLGESENVNYSDLGFEKTLIAMSQRKIKTINYENSFDGLRNENTDLLKEYIFYRKSVCLQICAFKKQLWSFMMYNPLHIILDLHMN